MTVPAFVGRIKSIREKQDEARKLLEELEHSLWVREFWGEKLPKGATIAAGVIKRPGETRFDLLMRVPLRVQLGQRKQEKTIPWLELPARFQRLHLSRLSKGHRDELVKLQKLPMTEDNEEEWPR